MGVPPRRLCERQLFANYRRGVSRSISSSPQQTFTRPNRVAEPPSEPIFLDFPHQIGFGTARIATVPKPITADSLDDLRKHLNYLPIFRQNGGVFFDLRGTRHTALYRGERRSAPPYNENGCFPLSKKEQQTRGRSPKMLRPLHYSFLLCRPPRQGYESFPLREKLSRRQAATLTLLFFSLRAVT